MTRLFAGTPFDIPPTCELCGQLEAECRCTPAEKNRAQQAAEREQNRLPPSEQTATIRVERRKGNRQATVVSGLSATANDLPQLLAELQAICGTGGTVKTKTETLELQGNHAETVRSELRRLGYRIAK